MSTTGTSVLYGAMAATASRVLADHAGLPAVIGVEITQTTSGTSPARFRPAITLQMSAGSLDEVRQMARWATAFGVPIRLIRHEGYVQVSAETVVDGHPVVVWDHISSDTADTLAAALGEQLATVLDIDPARLPAAQDNQGSQQECRPHISSAG